MAVTLRRAATMAAPIGIALVTPAHAATTEINTADAAWMIVATALVLMMTIPGLALFFSGMVRNVVHLSAGTGTQRFLIQLQGVAVTFVWSAGASFVLLKLVALFVPLRVSREHELEGLHISQHGEALQ